MPRTGSRLEDGFSLVEVLVALAILALMANLAIGSFAAVASATKRHSALSHIERFLVEARNEAQHRGKPVIVEVLLDRRRLQSKGGDRYVDIPIEYNLSFEGAGGQISSGGHASFEFFRDGTSTGGTLALSAGDTVIEYKVSWLTSVIDVVQE